MSSFQFRDRVALVTGGSSGIGLATARALAARGMHVWLVARDPAKLTTALAHVQADCISPGQNFGTVAADVADPEQAARAVAEVTRQAGLPDLVLNSAGITMPGHFQDLDLSVFHQMMEVNFFGTLHIVKAVVPGMIERGSGYIVNIGSLAGQFGMFGYSAYGASKFAVRGLTDVMRSELQYLGVHVSLVQPSDTDTPQLHFEEQYKPAETKALSASGTVYSPETVAAAIVRGVARGQYMILPGADTKFLYWLDSVSGTGKYLILDFMTNRAIRSLRRTKK